MTDNQMMGRVRAARTRFAAAHAAAWAAYAARARAECRAGYVPRPDLREVEAEANRRLGLAKAAVARAEARAGLAPVEAPLDAREGRLSRPSLGAL